MTRITRSPQQVEQVLQDKFSSKLDRDFIGGAGPYPTPTGILAVAAEVTGADLELAAVAAKAEIATAGGNATHIALSPALIGELESARDDIGRALYPDAGTVFAGLETVRSVAATQPSSTTPTAVAGDQPRLLRRDVRPGVRGVEPVRAVASDRRAGSRWPRRCPPSPCGSCRSPACRAGTHAESAKRAARS